MKSVSRPRAFPDSDICGVGVCRINTCEFIHYVCSRAHHIHFNKHSDEVRPPLFITYLNAACSNIAASDPDYSNILYEADLVYADGQAIVWASQLLGAPLPERVNAGDFILDFCRLATDRQLSIGLIGGRPKVARRAADIWRNQVPELRVAGAWNGFFDGNEQEIIDKIRRSGTKILLVGMGVPLQEKWAWAHRHELGVKAIWCVGALFEYYGEGRARAPVWVRRMGMEWFFRLMLEPRRLWKRYLVGNVRFVWRVMRARLTRKD